MIKFKKLFPKCCSVIGMVHLDALPGSVKYKGSIEHIVKKACIDTEIFLKNNIDGILIENMHDVPYLHRNYVSSETIAAMTRIGTEIRKITPASLPCGVQVLAGANKEAIAIAQSCDFQFVRAEGFVFGHIADEGYMDGDAGILLRYRKEIEANVAVYCDIKKKHSSHAITNDINLEDTAKAAEFFMADGVILTGKSTGTPVDNDDLKRVRSCGLPILIGSGVTLENLESYLSADALIVGSYFKKSGKWDSDLCNEKVERFMNKIASL